MQTIALLLAPLLTATVVIVSGRRTSEDQRNFVGRIGSFPFMQYLANPCGIVGGTRVEGDDNSLGRVHEEHLEKLKAEMSLSTRLASLQLSRIRADEAILQCNGMTLNSLPSVPSLFGIQPMEAYRLMYRDLLYLSGHLHFMAIDTKNSNKFCFNRTRVFTRQVQGLAGKLEYLLCNIIQMVPTESLRPILEEVLDLELYHQPSCSGRATRDCLVLDRTSQFLDLMKHYLEEDRYDSNFLYKMLKRSRALLTPPVSSSASFPYEERSAPAHSHPASSNSEAGEVIMTDKAGIEETFQPESPYSRLLKK